MKYHNLTAMTIRLSIIQYPLISLYLYIVFTIFNINDNHFVVCKAGIEYHIDGPWNLPVIPSKFPDPKSLAQLNTTHNNKLIPRHLWIAIRDANDGLNYQLPLLFQRNPLWEIHVTTNEVLML